MVSVGTYFSMYETGAKSVSVRTFYLEKNTREPAYGNYDLSFSKSGLLLFSVHTEKNKNYEIAYIYDPAGKLIKYNKLNSVTKELEEVAEYIFDRKGRILRERYRSYYPRLSQKVSNMNIIHTYKPGSEITVITSDDDDQYTTYYTYNNKGKLLEEKSFYKIEGLHEWIKIGYDENDNQVNSIAYQENGDVYRTVEYLPDQNGLFAGYRYISENYNYLREYVYQFNDCGHWISQVEMRDGVPHEICERSIDYY